jgi:hypothetical protein
MKQKPIDMKDMIKHYQIRIDDIQKYTKEKMKDIDNQRAYFVDVDNLARTNYYAGLESYLLDYKAASKSHFKEATKFWIEYYSIRSGNISRHTYHWMFLEGAIFSEDLDLRRKTIQNILNEIKYNPLEVNPLIPETLTICHLLNNDLQKANRLNDELRKQEELTKKSNWASNVKFIGRYLMMEGLISHKINKFLEGCIAGLKKYDRSGDSMAPVCSEVLKYLFLSKEYNLGIKKEDIPDKLRIHVFRFFAEALQDSIKYKPV